MEMLKFLPNHDHMRRAADLAREAYLSGEVPVGAVIVKNNKIISEGRNRREEKNNALLHAEIEAIDKACKALNTWRLSDCVIYVTLEPCPMCAGAIINSRIDKVVFGAYDEKAGSFGSVTDLSKLSYDHRPEIWGGILEDECSELMKSFFDSLRK